jgi:predicted aspartyl protease
MGLTYIQGTIVNPAKPRRSARLKFLVDSGAVYSVVPGVVLRRLGIKPGISKSFILADGSEVKRSIGQALFRIRGEEGASPVIFGEEGDSVLLGSVSLEALGFLLDPLKRELRPLPMLLATQVSGPSQHTRSVQEWLMLFRRAQERQSSRERKLRSAH